MRFSAEAALDEGTSLLTQIAGERRDKLSVNKAARAINSLLERPIPAGRVYKIWRQEATPKAHELDALRAAAGIAREARNEYRELTARIARLEAALRVQDAEFSGPQADALRQATGGPHSPLGSQRGLGKPSGLEGGE